MRSYSESRRTRPPRLKPVGAAGTALALGVLSSLAVFAQPAVGATTFSKIEVATLTPSGSLDIKAAGTVIDSRHVEGQIAIKANNVTIINTVVENSSYNSIRVYPGVKGTRIINTKVLCQNPRTNGIVHGDYLADRVDLVGCRHDFLFSDTRPATVTNSSVDGVPYATNDSGPIGTPPPSPGPSPTTSPTRPPSTPPTQPPSLAPGGFPHASTTGVPAGTTLRPSENITVTAAGTVIDGLDVQGTISVQANNVTIRNTRIRGGGNGYPIRIHNGVTGAIIDRVEVDNLNSTGIGIYFSGGSGVVRNSNIHSAEDGIRIEADNVTVEQSYVHHMARTPVSHNDTIQIRRGDNVTIRNNNLQIYHPGTGDPMNAAIQIGSLIGSDRISNLRVTGNLMNGGNVTVNGGGRGEVDGAVYSHNRFGRDFRYGVRGNIENSVWDATNVYDDTGTPAT